ncbi:MULTISPECIES: ORF6N domain-containing protein [unclassified Flavobacterium]|uniref:ORF6N domain-containing protein n=1 Tax=unclassified Flavobacterium TaxID=196869 RepID=UPI0012AA6963|nr:MULTISPECIES: ORF6N domain-containing protein [unclassified Flavobacterium]MBF4483669.1 ORF6N domain-containing protein [Flavobacterium sp. CSZ]QGK76214.1 ORF6N domain-containing protein [Flavobacterium sp. SLB02]
MEDQSLLSEETISNKIYFIRGQKVMLDSDLALLYEVETKTLNEQVKRNLSRFPEDFMFQLTEIEHNSLRSQIATLEKVRGKYQKYLPFTFTEHGVLMLSSVLKSDKAIQTNIQIIRIFTKVRQMLLDTTEIKVDILQIQKKLENHDKNIELVFSYLDEFTEKKEDENERVKIGYKK